MPSIPFVGFYPSRPFWAVNKVDFSDRSREGWFHDQMAEEVFSEETIAYALKISRDGRIMLRVEALEKAQEPGTFPPIEESVQKWGNYLDYLNAFYLLLDSSTIEISRLQYFNLHEITNRDAFRVNYENGQARGENIATESIASVFQMERYLSNYRHGIPIEHDPAMMRRQVISIETIRHASSTFATVVATPGLAKTLASFAKSLSEYKIGNYETSVVLSWFITEAALNKLWKAHIGSLNFELTEGRKRINRERRDFLTGRDFTISMVSNLLELWGVLPHSQFQEIDAVRAFRNKIVHSHGFAPGPTEAQLAMKTAQAMIHHSCGLQFTPNTGYSVAEI